MCGRCSRGSNGNRVKPWPRLVTLANCWFIGLFVEINADADGIAHVPRRIKCKQINKLIENGVLMLV